MIFQRGEFFPSDTEQVVRALNLYLLGLLPASVDWLLNYAFYARGDTRTPALVGIASVGIYLVVALSLLQPLGFLGLVLADSAKHTGHVLIMGLLLHRRLGSLTALRGRETLLKTLLAAVVMALLLAGLTPFLRQWLAPGFLGNLILVAVAGSAGAAAYLIVVTRLGVEEASSLLTRIWQQGRKLPGY